MENIVNTRINIISSLLTMLLILINGLFTIQKIKDGYRVSNNKNIMIE